MRPKHLNVTKQMYLLTIKILFIYKEDGQRKKIHKYVLQVAIS